MSRTLEELLNESKGEKIEISPFDRSKELTWHRNMLQVAELSTHDRVQTQADRLIAMINKQT